jgi:hypothetical protein
MHWNQAEELQKATPQIHQSTTKFNYFLWQLMLYSVQIVGTYIQTTTYTELGFFKYQNWNCSVCIQCSLLLNSVLHADHCWSWYLVQVHVQLCMQGNFR